MIGGYGELCRNCFQYAPNPYPPNPADTMHRIPPGHISSLARVVSKSGTDVRTFVSIFEIKSELFFNPTQTLSCSVLFFTKLPK
jgi:hypothetical protein